ncbi:DddA-like double-stranded DNA deaminase toxin [Streptomyces griseorubiginosus]|uniref:DddA-like double-stranded DNA deaminase toxin n=1 Tax=Streptomyces griseorubiginosus TaxID=67304 RepID=UPI00362A70FD
MLACESCGTTWHRWSDPFSGVPGNKTTGQLIDQDGKALSGEMISGDAATNKAINDFLIDRCVAMPGRAGKGPHPTVSHGETKYAWQIRNELKEQHSVVVINNPNGVCSDTCNCFKSVQAILPKDWTMTVWYPSESGMASKVLHGAGPPV